MYAGSATGPLSTAAPSRPRVERPVALGIAGATVMNDAVARPERADDAGRRAPDDSLGVRLVAGNRFIARPGRQVNVPAGAWAAVTVLLDAGAGR